MFEIRDVNNFVLCFGKSQESFKHEDESAKQMHNV